MSNVRYSSTHNRQTVKIRFTDGSDVTVEHVTWFEFDDELFLKRGTGESWIIRSEFVVGIKVTAET